MPRYYCDTTCLADHFSMISYFSSICQPSVRKQHMQDTSTRIKKQLGQTAAFQRVAATYNQHLVAQRPQLPILPTPVIPMGMQFPNAPLIPGIRPRYCLDHLPVHQLTHFLCDL
ncbi:U1 small nuclear ribonucleoprotein C-like isoform X1 [Punica granatum]|uniref:U1 small nuclear ribonucleoprotein C-like isoform X1 n=1 Tax=Punica granatum TaxID=22663 RepID=A0A6P8E231_PUNGR|nr:U1 small nuclear ribonucleoprotein C-like isoform X1 [Punica granatum]